MTPETTIDPRQIIDEAPLGPRQYLIYFILFLTLAIDGLDTQITSYLAPVLAKEWEISMANLGLVFGIGLAGSAVGALTLGALGDALGNKRIIVIATIAIGVATVAMGYANTVTELAALRFITGFAVGGSLPNLIALVSQFTPKRLRASLITMIGCGFPAGAALAGLMATWLLDSEGWRSIYHFAGYLPLLLTPVIIFFLPESLVSLLKRPDGQVKVRQIFERIYGAQLSREVQFRWANASDKVVAPLAAIFRDGRALASVMLSAIFFLSLMNVYFLSNWLPGLLSQLHSTPHEAIVATTVFNLGGMFGALVLGRLIDRFGYARTLCTSLLCSGACMLMLARFGFTGQSLQLAAFVGGFVVLGGQGGLNSLPALIYPDHLRATATGWAIGTGRLGSVTGPLLAGALLGAGWGSADVLSLTALVPALASILLAILALKLMRRSGAQ